MPSDRNVIVSRGKKYDRVTGRYLGTVSGEPAPPTFSGGEVRTQRVVAEKVEPEDETLQVAEDLTLAQLKDLAKSAGVVGYSTSSKAQLVEQLVALGLAEASDDRTGEYEEDDPAEGRSEDLDG